MHLIADANSILSDMLRWMVKGEFQSLQWLYSHPYAPALVALAFSAFISMAFLLMFIFTTLLRGGEPQYYCAFAGVERLANPLPPTKLLDFSNLEVNPLDPALKPWWSEVEDPKKRHRGRKYRKHGSPRVRSHRTRRH